jgi:hypothetical protein
VPTSVLLPLIVFFALGLPILVLLWRVFVVGGELRRDAQHGRAAMSIARRADVSLAELTDVVDDLRRRRAGPEASAASLRASADALRRYSLEAESVDRHVPHGDGAGLRAEFERAERAVELIEYGRQLMLDPSGDRGGEGETAVKRGYLNLVHSRDAIHSRAQEIAVVAAAPKGKDPRTKRGGR